MTVINSQELEMVETALLELGKKMPTSEKEERETVASVLRKLNRIRAKTNCTSIRIEAA